MILRAFTAALLLISCSTYTESSHASGGVIKRCTKECEAITVDHFKEVYGPICSEETKEGQRILEKIRDYKAQLIMRKKGDPYLEEKDWKKIKNKDEQAKMKARAILDPAKNAKVREELEALSTSCDEDNIKLISQIDMLNNSPRLASKFKPELNGVLSKDEKRDPFAYGMQCIAQCRDPEPLPDGTYKSGRDPEAEQVYKPKASAE